VAVCIEERTRTGWPWLLMEHFGILTADTRRLGRMNREAIGAAGRTPRPTLQPGAMNLGKRGNLTIYSSVRDLD
jgi:hypothetical protein